MTIDVGKRLRALREAQNLSQRQLADMSGVTNGMISMVEQNRTSPSILSLTKILGGLGVAMSEFFAVDAVNDDRFFYMRDELSELSPNQPNGGSGVSLLQVGDIARHSIQMQHVTFRPDVDSGELFSARAVEIAGIVVSGCIEVTVGDRTQLLGAGDAYLFDSRLPHRFRNIGKDDCVIISASAPLI